MFRRLLRQCRQALPQALAHRLRSAPPTTDSAWVAEMSQMRLWSYFFGRVITWHAAARARTSSLQVVFDTREFLPPDQTELRLDSPKSLGLRLSRRWRRVPDLLGFVHQNSRRPLRSTQAEMSPRFLSLPLSFSYRSSRSPTIRKVRAERIFSTLITPFRLPVSPIHTMSKKCATC